MSLTVIKHIICELTGYRPGTVDVSQGDRGSRAVSCRLMENGAPWMIPEGATARVAYTLPDGTEGLYDRRPDGSPMWEISGNIVTVELADQLMAQAGMVQMSILILGPEGGQLATWPIRVMVSADSAARLTVPEAMPPYGAGFAGKIFFGGEDGTVTPLGIGDGVEIVRQEDGTFVLVASGGAGGGGGIVEEKDPTVYAWAKQPKKPTYTAEEVGALPKDTKIPGKTSELTNDAGFVDKAVSDLANYYTKVQTQELIAAIPRFRVTVVQQLPAAGEELVLYLVPFATAEGQYLEYIWVDGRWEIIGSQRVDLTGYATELWVKDYVKAHTGQNLTLDTTLTQSGKAADAKVVGDALDKLEEKIPSIEGLAKEEAIPTKPEDIGAQPKGNYLTEAPVTAVNGKTGAVVLGAADVGADPKGTAAAAVSGHNTNNEAHPDIRLEIKAIREQLAAFLDVDEETLNELSELIAAIAANQTSIAQLTTGKVNVADIIDNLVTSVADKPLSAAQGAVLKGLIDGLITGKLDASKLTEAINAALAQAKASGAFDGAKGDPGVSPTVAVSAITGGHRISITDKSGTKTVDVMDGENGDPGRGIKSIARTSGNGDAGTTDTYTITYTDGTTSTFTVRNGSNGAPGQAATFAIASVTALEHGAAPTVTEASDSTAQARKYVMGIPAGKPGSDATVTAESIAKALGYVPVGAGTDSPLTGKKIVYDGDSICAAAFGYPKLIADKTACIFDNQAVGGARLCAVSDKHSVVNNLANLPTDGDIYCFEGGINDWWANTPVGTFAQGDYTGAVDATTIYGAMETICRYALTNLFGKAICFVIVHKIQNSAYSQNTAGHTFWDYRKAMIDVCEKYSVPYYDAFTKSGLNGWNAAQKAGLFVSGDGTHPNETAYEAYYVPQLIALFESIVPVGDYEAPAKPVTYENVLKTKTVDASGNPYNDGKGYKENTYLNGSGVEQSSTNYDVTGFIACKIGDVFRLKNVQFCKNVNGNSKCQIQYYKADKSLMSVTGYCKDPTGLSEAWQAVTNDAGTDIIQFTIPTALNATLSYIRITCGTLTDASIITINEEID